MTQPSEAPSVREESDERDVRPDSQRSARDAEEIRRIEAIFRKLEVAFAEADAVAFDAPFTADLVFTAVNGERFWGWDALHTYHREGMSNGTAGIRTWYEIERVDFPETETVAVVHSRQPIEMGGTRRVNVGMWVLVKRDGEWWISAGENTGVAEG